MRYKALIASNTSQTGTGNPKILLRHVTSLSTGEIFRDHCWVDISPEINKVRSKKVGDNRTYEIEFDANLKEYYNRRTGDIDKVTLTHICNGTRNPKPVRKPKNNNKHR